jgi:hypothetical protein
MDGVQFKENASSPSHRSRWESGDLAIEDSARNTPISLYFSKEWTRTPDRWPWEGTGSARQSDPWLVAVEELAKGR